MFEQYGLLQLRSLLSSAWEAQISEPMDSVREGDRGHCAYFSTQQYYPTYAKKNREIASGQYFTPLEMFLPGTDL